MAATSSADYIRQSWCLQKHVVHLLIYACICTQERHHKVIRRNVVNRHNTTALEQGLAEDLVIESLRALEEEPQRDGFVGAHAASQTMVQKLVFHLSCSGNYVETCVEVRAGALKVHRSDVALYSFDGVNIMAGDVFFCTCARMGRMRLCDGVEPSGRPTWFLEVRSARRHSPCANPQFLREGDSAHWCEAFDAHTPPPRAELWLMLVSCNAMQNIAALIGDAMRRDTAPKEVL